MLATAGRLVPALALVAALSVVPGACARHAEAPPVVDAAPARPPQPGSRDAAAPRPIDGHPVDAPSDTASSARAHRSPPPRAAADVFKVEGGITRADAESVLGGARAQLNACYQKELGKKPALAGRVNFRLSIDNRGNVPMAEVLTSTLGGGDPERCMVKALRELQFPPSPTGGESTLSFPMTFGR
jgi:hypothetical protein